MSFPWWRVLMMCDFLSSFNVNEKIGVFSKMKAIIFLMSSFLISGCVNEVGKGQQYGKMGSVFIDGNNVCFSVDKKEVLENYEFTAVGKVHKKLLSGRSIHLSYPKACFMAPLEKGVIYRASYMLDKKNFYDVFIISRDGRVVRLWTYTDCPYLSAMPF